MAILCRVMPLLLMLSAGAAYAQRRSAVPPAMERPAERLVMQPRQVLVRPGIDNPLTAKQRKQFDADQAQPTVLPRLQTLPLARGWTVMVDRSVRVRLDLATLWDKRVAQPNTYSLTFEAQSGMGWLWLTWQLPGAALPPLDAHGEEGLGK